jgi:hypothetical protein
MKKFLAILVVAILATSFSFALPQGSGATGTVNVTVEYPDITPLQHPADNLSVTLQPDQKSGALQFVWRFSGAVGIGYTLGGSWGSMPTGLSIVTHDTGQPTPVPAPYGTNFETFLEGTNFNETTVKLDFSVYCAAGTLKTESAHVLTYTLTIDY